jgi:hypothetical protein
MADHRDEIDPEGRSHRLVPLLEHRLDDLVGEIAVDLGTDAEIPRGAVGFPPQVRVDPHPASRRTRKS